MLSGAPSALAEERMKSGRILNRMFISAWIVRFLTNLASIMSNTMVPKYARFLGATNTMVGFIANAYAITALVLKIVSAPAMDAYNKKKIMFGATFVQFLAFVLYTLSGSIPFVISARLLQGVAQAFTTTCCMAMAASSLPKEKMATGLGIYGLAQTLCQAIATNIGTALVDSRGYNFMFGFVTCTQIVALAMILILFKSKDYVGTGKFKISLWNIVAKDALPVALMLGGLQMAYCCTNAFLLIYAEEVRGITTNLALYFTIYAVAQWGTRPLIGMAFDRWGTHKTVVPCICLFAAGFLIISVATEPWMFYVAAVLNAFGHGGMQPSLQGVGLRCAPPEKRGAASCTCYMIADGLQIVSSTFAGWVADTFGYILMWRVMLVPMAAVVVVAFLFKKQIKKTEIQLNK